jgi:hypothetical protein
MKHDPALARHLLPFLQEACNGRLDAVSWFRADWQRGGASTARARWKLDTDSSRDVIIKFPVIPHELFWTRRLQNSDGSPPDSIPHLFASGMSLGHYDLAWMVIELLPFGPLGMRWHRDHVPRICQAAARFQLLTNDLAVDDHRLRIESWDDLLDRSRESIRDNTLTNAPRWVTALKRVQRISNDLVVHWRHRDGSHWIHGDLHLANAMSRKSTQQGDVVLIDLAEVRCGHWTEDAVFLERQLWSRPDRLDETRPVREMARARRRLDLVVEEDAHELADIRRILMAATAPAFLRTEGHPRHLAGALAQLERALDRVGS